jgi:hypothetical protein
MVGSTGKWSSVNLTQRNKSADIYSGEFHKHRHARTEHAAELILSLVRDALPSLNSAVDFGCGTGTWLSVLRNMGAETILGIEGPWADVGLLNIPKSDFRHADLESSVELDRSYDLALSLEVAEHLSPTAGDALVKSLANASDFVLFSAAIPGQGGKGHLNEQWQDYWAARFAQVGFEAIDLVRPQIWSNKDIPTWYRQNILLFVKQERQTDLTLQKSDANDRDFLLSVVHPETFTNRIHRQQRQLSHLSSIRGSLRQFFASTLTRLLRK